MILQKISCQILDKIDSILSKVSHENKKVREVDSRAYDFYRLKFNNDVLNNPTIIKIIENETKINPEFKQMKIKDIIFKSLQELEQEGYIQFEDSGSDIKKNDYIYFTDKRKDIQEYILNVIRESGSSGILFSHLCDKVKKDFSKFYNMESVLNFIPKLFEQSLVYEISKGKYAASTADF